MLTPDLASSDFNGSLMTRPIRLGIQIEAENWVSKEKIVSPYTNRVGQNYLSIDPRCISRYWEPNDAYLSNERNVHRE